MKIIFIVIIILLYNLFEISVFKINKVKLKSKKLDRGYRFVQISDFHNNIFINLNKLINDIRKFNPDAVFLTGDIISRNTEDFKNVKKLLSGLKNYNVYYVQGNHELDNKNESQFNNILNEYGVINLSSKEMNFGNSIKLYGNPFGTMYKINFNLSESFYNILLTHDPKEFTNYGGNYDLVLSGHNHGGQVRMPFVGQLIDHSGDIFPKYSKGLYKVNNTDFYMDSGLGQSVHFRLLNRVQITEFTIEKLN